MPIIGTLYYYRRTQLQNLIPTTILLKESDSNWKTDSYKVCLENGL